MPGEPSCLGYIVNCTLLLAFRYSSIIYASKVDILWNLGDEEGARKKAEQAETWSLIATVGGVFAGIIVFMCTLLTT